MQTTSTSNISGAVLPRPSVPLRHRGSTYQAVIARSDQHRRAAFTLRHASYLESGYIDPRDDRIFRDEFDDLPQAETIIVYDDERPVASVRVCFLSHRERTSPARAAFPDRVDAILDETPAGNRNVVAAEITRLVRSPDCANNQGLVFLLYRLAGHLVLHKDVQVILSSVRHNHVPFYRRLGFVEASEAKPYPGLSCPMSLMRCERRRYDGVRAGFRLMDPDAVSATYFAGFLDGDPITMPLTPR